MTSLKNSQSAPTAFDSLPLFLTVTDICSVLGLSKNTVYAMLRSGQLQSVRCGRQIRVPKESLRSFSQ